MRKKILIILTLIPLASCFMTEKITIQEIINEKEQIDSADNPARAYLLKKNMSEKVITIQDAVVKDVTESSNIDYNFCIIVDIPVKNKKIECYVYSKNIKTISSLVKGKTVINIEGEFNRFFTMLDDYYTKIEIINASITIKEGE